MKRMNWPVYFILLLLCLTMLIASAVGNGHIPFIEKEPRVFSRYQVIERTNFETQYVEVTEEKESIADLLYTANTMVVRR